jgi:hypothetical protein
MAVAAEWLLPPPGSLTLTAPEAGDSFFVRGIDEINKRARTWALTNRYLLCGGVPTALTASTSWIAAQVTAGI